MKIKRIFALPFALVADVATLGNVGGMRSFTQQVFDQERREQDAKDIVAVLEVLARINSK